MNATLPHVPPFDPPIRLMRVAEQPRPHGGWHYVIVEPRACPHCSGSGICLDEELQLEGLCPECGGTGEEQ